MHDKETINEFNAQLCDMANKALSLGGRGARWWGVGGEFLVENLV